MDGAGGRKGGPGGLAGRPGSLEGGPAGGPCMPLVKMEFGIPRGPCAGGHFKFAKEVGGPMGPPGIFAGLKGMGPLGGPICGGPGLIGGPVGILCAGCCGCCILR